MNSVLTLTAVSLALCASVGFTDTLHYKMVIDAGSSGSRLHIYQYDTSKAVPGINQVFTENIKPGLASMADSSQAAAEYIAKLKVMMNDAQVELTKRGANLKETQLSLLGTAGMRVLPEGTQQDIYKQLNPVLGNYDFPIHEMKTMTGQMEGLYGWLDVNYLLGNFQNHTDTKGSIEMGGASTQIAYAIADSNNPNQISLDIDHIHYTISSTSFLGLGQDLALNTMVKTDTASTCFPPDYTSKDIQKGLFNRDSCARIYTDMMDKQHVGDQAKDIAGLRFIAYSGIYYTLNFFGADTAPDQGIFETKIDDVCGTNWSALKLRYPDVSEKYLASYCANGVYENQLLFNTYKLQAYQLTVENQIIVDNKAQDIDWTLGAVLYDLVRI